MVEVLPEGALEWVPCLTTNTTALDDWVTTYITTGGPEIVKLPKGVSKTDFQDSDLMIIPRKTHYIHSVKFYDNEPPETEIIRSGKAVDGKNYLPLPEKD